MIWKTARMATLGLCVLMLVVAGCDKAPKDSGKLAPAAKKEHDHPDKGPHGGPFAEWGDEEYHVEFTVDHDKKEATVYILGPDAKTHKAIDTRELILALKTEPLEKIIMKPVPQADQGDKDGNSSRFVGTHEVLGKKMEFEGTVSGKVGKTPYSGDFKEKAEAHKH